MKTVPVNLSYTAPLDFVCFMGHYIFLKEVVLMENEGKLKASEQH